MERVAGSEEVAVQRVHPTSIDGPSCGHEGLGGDLAPEDALACLVEMRTAECVHLDDLEIEERDKVGEGFSHLADDRLCACRP
jgi:hypothetical protein